MRGEPAEPILFEVAVRELWGKFAAHGGINLTEHQLAGTEERSSVELQELRQLDVRLGELRDEARFRIWSLAMVGELKAWLGDGEHWRRPTERQLRERLTRAGDEPTGLYLDHVELDAVTEARWSAELTSALPNPQPGLADKAHQPRGRPPASGTYALSDAPLLDEMRSLLVSGEARSINHAAETVVHRVPAQGGGTNASKVTRLRKAYVRMFGRFGE